VSEFDCRDIRYVECLDLISDFEFHLPRRTAQIRALDHAAIFESDGVGEAGYRQRESESDCKQTHKIPFTKLHSQLYDAAPRQMVYASMDGMSRIRRNPRIYAGLRSDFTTSAPCW
jgi:hypothetical protein